MYLSIIFLRNSGEDHARWEEVMKWSNYRDTSHLIGITPPAPDPYPPVPRVGECVIVKDENLQVWQISWIDSSEVHIYLRG